MELHEGRPWAASAILLGDDPDAAIHGDAGGRTFCGIPSERYEVSKDPFFGNGPNDCPVCADRFLELDFDYRDHNP